MTTTKDYLKVALKIFLFLMIGWILMIPLIIFLGRVGVESRSWAYLVIRITYMVLVGILIYFVVNRKNLSSRPAPFKKSREYYGRLTTQLLIWTMIGIVVIISDLFKLNYFDSFLWNLSVLISPENPRGPLTIFLGIGVYTVPFLFITAMGAAYLIMEFLFDQGTAGENTINNRV